MAINQSDNENQNDWLVEEIGGEQIRLIMGIDKWQGNNRLCLFWSCKQIAISNIQHPLR